MFPPLEHQANIFAQVSIADVATMSSQETPVNDAALAARVKQAVDLLRDSVLEKINRLFAAKRQECPSFSEGVPADLPPENFHRALLTVMTYERAEQIAAASPPLREDQVQEIEKIAADPRTRLVEVGGDVAKEGEQASTRHE